MLRILFSSFLFLMLTMQVIHAAATVPNVAKDRSVWPQVGQTAFGFPGSGELLSPPDDIVLETAGLDGRTAFGGQNRVAQFLGSQARVVPLLWSVGEAHSVMLENSRLNETYTGWMQHSGRAYSVDLSGFSGNIPDTFQLELFDQEILTVDRHSSHEIVDGVAWRGMIEGSERVGVTMTARGDRLIAHIELDGSTYVLLPTDEMQYVLFEIDFNSFPGCGGTIQPKIDNRSSLERNALDFRPGSNWLSEEAPDFPSYFLPRGDSIRIDVMSLYTADARVAAGGIQAIEDKIWHAYNLANTGFINSSMNIHYYMVYMGEYVHGETGDAYQDLPNFASNAAEIRNQVGADLASLIVQESNVCGLAYMPFFNHPNFESSAFQLTRHSCIYGNVWAHEHGHNLGMEHNPENAAFSPAYDFAYGHWDSQSSQPFRTIMSYMTSDCSASGCQWITQFSNPDEEFGSAATGTVGERDNAQAGLLMAPTVSRYRWGYDVELDAVTTDTHQASPASVVNVDIEFGEVEEPVDALLQVIVGPSESSDPDQDIHRSRAVFLESAGDAWTLDVWLPPDIAEGWYDVDVNVWYRPTPSLWYNQVLDFKNLSAHLQVCHHFQPGSFSDTKNALVGYASGQSMGECPQLASVEFGDLSQTYSGGPLSPTVATDPDGLSVEITFDGQPEPPIDAGSYAVVATIDDPNYVGSASDTFVIEQATATIEFADLTQTYIGDPLEPMITTDPEGLSVTVTYDGEPDAPIEAGSYAVVATIDDPNYSGSASDSFVIERAQVVIEFADLVQTFTGSPLAPTITTDPEGLAILVTYDDDPEPPIDVGIYLVEALVDKGNYTGSNSAQFQIVGEQIHGDRFEE